MSVAECLREAKEKIAAPGAWCQGALARDGSGDPCAGEAGVAWCALGAVWATVGPSDPSIAQLNSVAALRLMPGDLDAEDLTPLENYNDSPNRTHADILALFDAAIARAEAAS